MARKLLLAACGFSALCVVYLGAMSLLLQHPHMVQNLLVSLLILTTSVCCAAAAVTGRRMVKMVALLPTLPVLYVAASAWYATLHSSDTEGYILLIALVIFVQVGLAWIVLLSGISRRQTA